MKIKVTKQNVAIQMTRNEFQSMTNALYAFTDDVGDSESKVWRKEVKLARKILEAAIPPPDCGTDKKWRVIK